MGQTLESGDIDFAYRPRVETEEVRGLTDIQRFFVILSPRNKSVYRRILVGRKRLPEIAAHERLWAYVDRVAPCPEPVEHELEGAWE